MALPNSRSYGLSTEHDPDAYFTDGVRYTSIYGVDGSNSRADYDNPVYTNDEPDLRQGGYVIDDYDELDDFSDSGGCCGEAKINCSVFGGELRDEARQLGHSCKKFNAVKHLKSCVSMEKVKRIFPIIEWGPKYR